VGVVGMGETTPTIHFRPSSCALSRPTSACRRIPKYSKWWLTRRSSELISLPRDVSQVYFTQAIFRTDF